MQSPPSSGATWVTFPPSRDNERVAKQVCFWHIADIDAPLNMSALEHKADFPDQPLLEFASDEMMLACPWLGRSLRRSAKLFGLET
jgi:hypothetical protein